MDMVMRRSLDTLARQSSAGGIACLSLRTTTQTSTNICTVNSRARSVVAITARRAYGVGSWFNMRRGEVSMERLCEKEVEKGVNEFINSSAVERVMKEEVPFAPQMMVSLVSPSSSSSSLMSRDPHFRTITSHEDKGLKGEVRQMLIEGEMLKSTTNSDDICRRLDRLEGHMTKLPSLAQNEKDTVKKMQMVLIALHMVKRYDVNHHQRRPTTQLLHGMLNQMCRPTDTQLIEHSFNEVLQDRHSSSVQRMVACNRLAQLYATSPLALDCRQAERMLERAEEYMPSMKLTESNRQLVLKSHGTKPSFSSAAL